MDGVGRRRALIIGNSAYETLPFLEDPRRDASAMVSALTALGFEEVMSGVDLRHAEFLRRLQEFYDKLKQDEIALLFYAGHGVQVRGRNYLLPCDARIVSASDLRSNAILVDEVVNEMSRRTKTRLLFLDACRSDPITSEPGGLTTASRSIAAIGRDIDDVGQGLARIKTLPGTFVAYATEPGNVAYEGVGDNSPFTTALLRHIVRPGLPIDEVMMEVRVQVLDSTKGKQLPWSETGLTALFQFKDGPREGDSRDFEQEYWDRIKNTDNPDFLESFVRQFPDGQHAAEVHERFQRVKLRKEVVDWEQARTSGRIPVLKNFVRRYPDSPHSGTARTQIFLRQIGRGSTIFAAGMFAFVGTGALLGLLFYQSIFEVGPETEAIAFTVVPSIVYCGLLLFGLAQLRRPIRRTALALLIAAVPALIFKVGLDATRSWRPERVTYWHAGEKVRQLRSDLASERKASGLQSPPTSPDRIADRERELKEAQNVRLALLQKLSWEQRYFRLSSGALCGAAVVITLLLSGLAISGRRHLHRWAMSMLGGGLAGAFGVVALSSVIEDPSWSQILAGWGWTSIIGFLALGLALAAGDDDTVLRESALTNALGPAPQKLTSVARE